MADDLTRREFLKRAGMIGAAAYGLTIGGNKLFGLLGSDVEAASLSVLSVASNGSPEALVKKAIDGLGGIGKFVKRGNSVVIKPNFAWAREPSQAANTNPKIINALIKLCQQAGAGRITVVEHTCDSSASAFAQNDARSSVKGTRARLIAADNHNMYRKIEIPKGKVLKSDDCIRDILDADVFINVPIAKVHGASTITASMKNLMGANWERGAWHNSKDLEQCIADYSTAVKPNLIILDAIRILLTNGPKGPGETKDVGQVVASTDPVAIDAYAAKLLGKDPKAVKHISYAASMGLGQNDLKRVKIKKV